MAAAVAATSLGSPGKEVGQITKRYVESPISVLFWDTVEAHEQSAKLQDTIQFSVDDEDWDPELATGSSLTEFRVGEVLDDASRSKLFEPEAFECSDESRLTGRSTPPRKARFITHQVPPMRCIANNSK